MVLTEIIIWRAVNYIEDDDFKIYKHLRTQDFSAQFTMHRQALGNLSDAYYESAINTPFISKLMHDALHAKNRTQRELQREKLLQKLSPLYARMKEKGVRQLHFHLPNSISFLRFHRPKKFGDSLVGVRESLEYVNRYKKPVSCFEEGRIFNGFRNVYPIFYKKEFVGTVEVSYSFKALQQNMLRVETTSAYIFLMRSKIVEHKVFQSEKRNYKPSEFKGFSYDIGTINENKLFAVKTIVTINKDLSNRVKERMSQNKPFSIFVHSSDLQQHRKVIVTFIPVVNLNKKDVAYVIAYKKSPFIDRIEHKYAWIFFILTLLNIVVFIGIGFLFYNEKKEHDMMEYVALHDQLTGIYNRHGMYPIVENKFKEIKRYKEHLSGIFFDIDFFKKINDTYGHELGDYVLVTIVKIVKESIRESDIFVRWGGEEFIIFLPETSEDEAVEVAEKLRQKIESYNFRDMQKVTCSFGVSEVQKDETLEEFINRIDALLYKAKESGRNRVASE
jgi:diguanylate cyclase (GGDEF)-like protein